MSLSSDFATRLDAHLATFTSDRARKVFLQSQFETWQARYRNFCVRPRPSALGDIQPTAWDYQLTISEITTRLGRLERTAA